MDWDRTENGVIRERGVGATRTVSYYSAQGTLLATCPADARDFATRDLIPAGTPCPRPFSAAEVAASDAAAAQAAVAAQQASDRNAIVEQALVWLAQDSTQAAARISQIQAAINDINAQIAAVNGFTFNGTTVSGINAQLNTALKPQIVTLYTRLKQVGQMLQELMQARDKHGDYLRWIGRYLTG